MRKMFFLLLPFLLLGCVPQDVNPCQNMMNCTVYIEHDGISGSGVLISTTRVLTAKHVVEDANSVHITLNDGRVVESVAIELVDDFDMAYVIIAEVNNPVAQIRVDPLMVGEIVYVVGSPFGYELFNTVTHGIISSVERSLSYISGWSELFQIDASSYPGNSGGPVFDSSGRLIGIVVGGRDPSLVMCISVIGDK